MWTRGFGAVVRVQEGGGWLRRSFLVFVCEKGGARVDTT